MLYSFFTSYDALLSLAKYICFFNRYNPYRSTNFGMGMLLRRLRLIAIILMYIVDFYIMLKVYLGDFAHNVGQWIILSYVIVYDETIDCCICRHILLAVKFYTYVHSGTLDGFVLSQSMTTKDPFSTNESTLSSVSKQSIHNMFYENARTY